MKVFHLTAGNLYGGVESLLTTLARLRHLVPELEPEFGLCFPGQQRDELVAAEVPVHDLGPVRLSRPWTVRSARRQLASVLANLRPDVTITHGPWPHAVFGPALRHAGARVIRFAHNEWTRRHWLDRWANRTPTDLVLANSRYTATTVTQTRRDQRVEVWYSPVAPARVADAARLDVRAKLGTDPASVVILQASRLEPWKGQEVHLKALSRLRNVRGWECWMVGGVQKPGESQFLDKLRQVAQQGGIADRVRFLGQRSDMPRLMAAADIFCQPNVGPEPFGIVLVEALYAGLPVVSSAFGGAAEIVTPSCGLLTKPGNDVALAAVLAQLIADPATRSGFGVAGPGRAAELCDPAQVLQRLAGLLTCFVGMPDRCAEIRV